MEKLKQFFKRHTLPCLVIIAITSLNGCDTNPKDRYEHIRTDITLKVKLYDSQRELSRYVNNNFKVQEANRKGFAVWYKNDPTNECTIHVVKGTSDMKTYGHELMHCIYGSYHEEY